MKSTIVAWCRYCQHYVSEDEIGGGCPSTDCNRKLIKRRGYICTICTEICFGKKEFKAHMEYEHDIIGVITE